MVKALGEKIVAYEKPYNVLAKGEAAILEAAKRLVDQKIDVLALGCAGYSVLRIATKLEGKFDTTVADPVITTGPYAFCYIVKKSS